MSAPAFCLAWLRRQDTGGARPVDPITAEWLERLSVGRHVYRAANGAAGIISSTPLIEAGEFVVAAAGTHPPTALLRAYGQDDIARLARAPDGLAMARLQRDGRSLGLLRDVMGQRQMFYQDNGQVLVACSDLELLLRRPGWARRLDRAAAGHYLAFGTPGLGRTLEAGTRSLPAAHQVEIQSDNGPFVRRYWSPLARPGVKVLDEAHETALGEALDEAIAQAATGGDVAMLLSGGIDSGYMAHLLGGRSGVGRVEAYTIRFTSPGAHSECDAAAQTAASAGLGHRIIDMSAHDAAAGLEAVLASAQPRSAWSVLTHAHLIDAVHADGHQTLLSGLGADEVFGGYSHYLRAYLRFNERLEAYGQDGYERCLDDVLTQPELAAEVLFTGVPRFLDDATLSAVRGPALAGWTPVGDTIGFYREAREIRPRAHLFELMVAHECQNRVPDLLLSGFCTDAQRRAITPRYPFLAPDLAAMACRLGAAERFGQVGETWKNKLALRRLAARRLPPSHFHRPPMTFGAPFLIWLGDPQFRQSLKAIVDDASLVEGLIDHRWLTDLFETVQAQDPAAAASPEADQLWIVITLLGWRRKWIGNREVQP